MSHTPRDPIRALHDELEAAPGGIARAANRIGRSPGTLYNKFSGDVVNCEVSVREAIALAQQLASRHFVEAICEQFSGVFVPVPSTPGGDDDMLAANLEMVRRFGQLAEAFIRARADGIITPTEARQIAAVGNDTVQAVLSFVAEVEAQVRALPEAGPAR